MTSLSHTQPLSTAHRKAIEALSPDVIQAVADRRFVDRGLHYYKNYAVESLEWDAERDVILAHVNGTSSAPYEVSLKPVNTEEGFEHHCDCLAWEQYHSCKHVVAATCALFLAVQGKSPGSYTMPVDYAQQLREQLLGEANNTEETTLPEATETTLRLLKITPYGSLQFEIDGPIPQKFLKDAGVKMSNAYYGYSIEREFTFSHAELKLEGFIQSARKAGITLEVSMGELQTELTLEDRNLKRQLGIAYDGESVRYTEQFLDDSGSPVDAYSKIEESQWVLLKNGAFTRFEDIANESAHDWHPLAEANAIDLYSDTPYQSKSTLSDFNDDASVYFSQDHSALRLTTKNRAKKLKPFSPDEAPLLLDICPVLEESTERLVGYEYNIYAKVGDAQINLEDLLREWFDPFFFDSNRFLAAKKRVSGLQEAIREILSITPHTGTRIPGELWSRFPEVAESGHKSVAAQMIKHLLSQITRHDRGDSTLAIDPKSGQWLSYRINGRQIAMLIFSMAEANSAKGLMNLLGGIIPVGRHDSFSESLQRITTIANALNFEIRLEDNEVQTQPIKMELEGRSDDQNIDWFALHPSVRCGDRTLSSEEWKLLIQGKLLLRDHSGQIIIPDLGSDSETNLQLLARLLSRKEAAVSNDKNPASQGALTISRLEMLDWIALRQSGIQLTLPDEAEALFSSLLSFDQLPPYQQPKKLKATLRAYQKEGCVWIDFLYRHRFGACLADDMGLGKTLQAISFIAQRLETDPVGDGKARFLVVVPPSLVFNWLEEFNKFAPHIKVADCLKAGDFARLIKSAQVVLTTYDRVRVEIRKMKTHRFDVVVFDEAHNLKNITAARTKAASQLERRFSLCLSGTPVENNETEFFSVLSAAVPGIFGSLKTFRDDFREDANRILQRAKPFILRRTKEKILKELPPKEEHELFLEMTPMQKEIYTRTVAEVREEVAAAYEERPEQQAGIVALAAILRLRQVCVTPRLLGKEMDTPAPKFTYMADKLEELAAEGNAALVFSQFRGGLDEMEIIARERGLNYLRMDGQTPVAKRKDIVAEFQSKDGPPFFFISLKTGGVGLNLTRANYVFHLDPWWNPSVENQASDRAHRIGQTRSVFVQRLIMQHSIEARMLELKARKAELFRQLVDEPGQQTQKVGLSRGDFDYLLNG